MKDKTKRKLKAAAIVAYGIPVENGLDAVSGAYHATLGRFTKYAKHMYWEMRGYEYGSIVKACPNCKANFINTSHVWKRERANGDFVGEFEDFCEEHSPEAEEIFRGYKRTHKGH